MGSRILQQWALWLTSLILATMALWSPMPASAQAYLDAFGNIAQRPSTQQQAPAQAVAPPAVIYVPTVTPIYNGMGIYSNGYSFPAYAAPVVITPAPAQAPGNANQCLGVSCPPVRY